MELSKILLFTVDENIGNLFKNTLNENEYTLDMIASVDLLMDACKEISPDIVFVDVGNPNVKDAEKLYLLITVLVSSIGFNRLVIIADKIKRKVYTKIREIGAIYFLKKLINEDAILQKIENVISTQNFCKQLEDMVAEYVGFSAEHYIEQPLTAVLGASKTLRMLRESGRRISDDDLDETLDIIIEGSDELAATVKKFGKIKHFKTNNIIRNKKIIDLSGIEEDEFAEGSIQLF